MGAQKPENKLSTAARRRRVIALRRAGKDYRTIAAEIEKEFGADELPKGWDARYACKDFHRALEKVESDLEETAEEVLRLELQRLDKMLAAVWPMIATGSPPAIKTVLKIMERRAKYLGLDEPAELRATVGVDGQLIEQLIDALEEFPEARRAAAAVLAGADDA